MNPSPPTAPPAPPPGSARPNRLLALLMAPAHGLERARGRKRLVLVAFYLAILAVVGLFIWRELSIVGLPDVGEPFDVAAALKEEVPDAENAFVLYREAKSRLKPMEVPRTAPATPFNPVFDWKQAQPEVKDWLESNREPLEIWRRGTERPRVLDIPLADMSIDVRLDTIQSLRDFTRLATLEGSRLEAEGDMAGAYRMYRSILLSSRHADFQGTLIGRLIGSAIFATGVATIEEWAADPRTDPRLIREALADATTLRAAAAPNSLGFRTEYVWAVKCFRDPAERAKLDASNSGNPSEWYESYPAYKPILHWLKHEPTRSERVYRLYMKNLLAYCDLPPEQRPSRKGAGGLMFYAEMPGAPAGAHALPPEQVGAWLQSAPLARLTLPAAENALRAMDGQRRRHDSLIVTLAERLYRREQGRPPKTYGDLLGTYLDALPFGFEAGDVTAVEPESP